MVLSTKPNCSSSFQINNLQGGHIETNSSIGKIYFATQNKKEHIVSLCFCSIKKALHKCSHVRQETHLWNQSITAGCTIGIHDIDKERSDIQDLHLILTYISFFAKYNLRVKANSHSISWTGAVSTRTTSNASKKGPVVKNDLLYIPRMIIWSNRSIKNHDFLWI